MKMNEVLMDVCHHIEALFCPMRFDIPFKPIHTIINLLWYQVFIRWVDSNDCFGIASIDRPFIWTTQPYVSHILVVTSEIALIRDQPNESQFVYIKIVM